MVEGKVLSILDEYRIVVSLGKGSVNVGNKLMIYTLGEEIKDELGQSLGKLEIVKAKVEVEHVQEKFSTAVSPLISETVREEASSGISPLLSSFYTSLSMHSGKPKQTIRVERRREPLQIESTTPVDRTIRVGDLVRVI